MVTRNTTFRDEIIFAEDGDEFRDCVFVNSILYVEENDNVTVGSCLFVEE